MCAWLCTFVLNPLVSRVNRRMCIHMVRLWLDIGRTDVRRIGLALDALLADAGAFSRAVAALHALG